jgi:integrase/recombinase XerC
MAISQLEIAMDLIRSMHPLARAWLLDGPLSSYVEAFQALLERGQYAEGSSEKALRAWSHFSHWMTKWAAAGSVDTALSF